MLRSIGCLAVLLLAGIPLRAGELDTEFRSAPASTPAATLEATQPADNAPPPLLARDRAEGREAWNASEMDAESPSQAWGRCGFGWGGGFGRGFGFGFGGFGRGFGLGLGYSSFGLGYGGYGLGYGGYGLGYGGYGLGYGGYSSFGLLATSYASPFFGGWGGYGGWGGWGCW